MAFDVGNRLIAAIDVATAAQADAYLASLGGVPSFVKLGLELFCAVGPCYVREVVARGSRVMLDLKLHDIPETVGRATLQLAGLGVELCTVHAGAPAMVAAAVHAATQYATQHPAARPMQILAVTVLTSMTAEDVAVVNGATVDLGAVVASRAKMAVQAGAHGLVASAHEVTMLRGIVPAATLLVTPGIRPAGAALHDQKRVMTPAAARAAGADLIVVGRPLRDATSSRDAAQSIVAELTETKTV